MSFLLSWSRTQVILAVDDMAGWHAPELVKGSDILQQLDEAALAVSAHVSPP